MKKGRPFSPSTELIDRRRNTYIACEDMDFLWDEWDIYRVDEMWMDGFPITSIAEEMDRDPDEVLVLIIDRARKGQITARKGGILGGR